MGILLTNEPTKVITVDEIKPGMRIWCEFNDHFETLGHVKKVHGGFVLSDESVVLLRFDDKHLVRVNEVDGTAEPSHINSADPLGFKPGDEVILNLEETRTWIGALIGSVKDIVEYNTFEYVTKSDRAIFEYSRERLSADSTLGGFYSRD